MACAAVLVCAGGLTACGTTSAGGSPGSPSVAAGSTASAPTGQPPSGEPPSVRPSGSGPSAGKPSSARPSSGTPSGGRTTKPLAGKVVVLDPGHNIDNQYHTAAINRLVDIGNGHTTCDTTGTATNGGYPEADFTLDVARRARTLLTRLGATVKLTHDKPLAYGPCVDERARIGNEAHADAALSIHADGAGPADRGFHVILPAAVHAGIADTLPITAASRRLGIAIRDDFARDTGTSYSNYVGDGTALDVRGDLGGLNLSTVPKVFIECGNMRNTRDAALLTDAAWRQRAARGIADGIAAYLESR
jgi:N-acetylmuramoyl-L-alanine amidase